MQPTNKPIRNPIQPIYVDPNGIQRFKGNEIVRYLLDNGGIDLNHLARVEFPVDDREQFAQLIGYSLSGYSELGYVRDVSYDVAIGTADGKDQLNAEIDALHKRLREVRDCIRQAAVAIFRIHEDDLEE